MPFTRSKLHKIGGGASGAQLFSYDDTDAITAIVASGFFNGAAEDLKQGDFILVRSGAAGVAAVDLIIVTSASGATPVTTLNGT